MPAGRPTSYDPAYCERVIEYGEQGLAKVEIACKLGVTYRTLHNWTEKHDEFFHAIKDSEKAAERWYFEKFKDLGTGEIEKGNVTALIFAAKNQLPDTFRDRRDVDVKAEVGVFEINFEGFDDSDEESEG